MFEYGVLGLYGSLLQLLGYSYDAIQQYNNNNNIINKSPDYYGKILLTIGYIFVGLHYYDPNNKYTILYHNIGYSIILLFHVLSYLNKYNTPYKNYQILAIIAFSIIILNTILNNEIVIFIGHIIIIAFYILYIKDEYEINKKYVKNIQNNINYSPLLHIIGGTLFIGHYLQKYV